MAFTAPGEGRKPNVLTASRSVSVVDVARDPSVVQKLDYETWLPYAAKVYEISPKIEDYILVTTPICPSDLPNRNGIGFPLTELVKFQPPPISRQTYKAWAGCPVHYEHKNEIHEDAYGVILDARMQPIMGYGSGRLWKVMGLLAIEKYKYPEIARRVLEGDVNTYSMGAFVDYFTCSYCATEMSKHAGCTHVHPSNDIDWNEVRSYDSKNHIAYRNAHGIQPIECSIVESPAWVTALSDHVHEVDDSRVMAGQRPLSNNRY